VRAAAGVALPSLVGGNLAEFGKRTVPSSEARDRCAVRSVVGQGLESGSLLGEVAAAQCGQGTRCGVGVVSRHRASLDRAVLVLPHPESGGAGAGGDLGRGPECARGDGAGALSLLASSASGGGLTVDVEGDAAGHLSSVGAMLVGPSASVEPQRVSRLCDYLGADGGRVEGAGDCARVGCHWHGADGHTCGVRHAAVGVVQGDACGALFGGCTDAGQGDVESVGLGHGAREGGGHGVAVAVGSGSLAASAEVAAEVASVLRPDFGHAALVLLLRSAGENRGGELQGGTDGGPGGGVSLAVRQGERVHGCGRGALGACACGSGSGGVGVLGAQGIHASEVPAADSGDQGGRVELRVVVRGVSSSARGEWDRVRHGWNLSKGCGARGVGWG
jgi:hypothetical protein